MLNQTISAVHSCYSPVKETHTLLHTLKTQQATGFSGARKVHSGILQYWGRPQPCFAELHQSPRAVTNKLRSEGRFGRKRGGREEKAVAIEGKKERRKRRKKREGRCDGGNEEEGGDDVNDGKQDSNGVWRENEKTQLSGKQTKKGSRKDATKEREDMKIKETT